MNLLLEDVFKEKKPIIGMIHMAGKGRDEKVSRAVEEAFIYSAQGVDGIIVEDYFGDEEDVENALKALKAENTRMRIGVNCLRNTYGSFRKAARHGCEFIQVDSIRPFSTEQDAFHRCREEYASTLVMGGVRFKYQRPTGLDLEQDVLYGMQEYDAIVTTGDATGVETPIDKLESFRRIIDQYPMRVPLIVGAGVTADNAYAQLSLVDGAIIGSYFKRDGEAHQGVDKDRVARVMDIARKFR